MGISHKIITLFRVLKKLGLAAVIRLLREKIKNARKPYVLNSFNPSGLDVRTTTFEVLLELSGNDIASIDCLALEYQEYVKNFQTRSRSPRSTFFEEIFDIGPNMGQFLYLWIRIFKPKFVIETGVAAGASTNTLLSALKKNNLGQLISIDITPKVGELVEEGYKDRWSLNVINPKQGEKQMMRVLEKFPETALFLHDSDHSVEWQITEFKAAVKFLTQCYLIAFDDVSNQLIDYVRENHPEIKVVVFDENRKFSAIFLRAQAL